MYKKYPSVPHNCHSCLYRHGCPWDFDEIFTDKITGEHVWDNCKHWKLGKCYKCKYVDEPNEYNWYKRGCEAECFSGCKKFRRSFKNTKEFIKLLEENKNEIQKEASSN